MAAVMIAFVMALTPAICVADDAPQVVCDAQTIVIKACDKEIDSSDGEEMAVFAPTIELSAGTDGAALTLQLVADTDEDVKQRVRFFGQPKETPKYWIGIRMTPVPEPLAAHIGGEGVMVSNIVIESPADQAGIERYDVIIRFDGRDIVEPADLSAVIAEMKPGRKAKLTVLRGGQKQNLSIRPVDWPADLQDWDMKYDEPQDVVFDTNVQTRGLTLKQDENGNWIMHELGALDDVHDIVNKLHNFTFQWHDDDMFGNHNIDLHMLHKLHEGDFMFFGDDVEGQRTMNIVVERDGEKTSIKVDDEGLIHVERSDAEGNESIEVYESDEDFEAEDPEAYELYSQHAHHGSGAKVFMHGMNFGSDTEDLRHQFTVEIHEKLTKAMEDALAAQESATVARHEALEKARAALQAARARHYAEFAPNGGTTDTLGVEVNDDGVITIITRGEEGQIMKRRYSSEEALMEADPELYEQVEDMLE